jgi:hypothetical protein
MPPTGRPLYPREDGLGRILDDEQVAVSGDLHDRVHLAGHTGVMDGHNGLRPVGDRLGE